MKAIILAVGRGSRMKALTVEIPKCLVKLRGTPLLDRQLGVLRAAGIHDIAIVTGYCHDLLSEYNLEEFYNTRWADTNMVASLSCAAAWLEESPCIVTYSDIFYDVNAIISLMEVPASLAVTYDPNWAKLWRHRFSDPLSDAETFLIGANSQLLEIGKQPTTLDQIQGQFMGITLFTPDSWNEFNVVLSRMSKHLADQLYMTDTLQKVIEAGNVSILGVPYEGKWGEVDSESDLLLYEDSLFFQPRIL